MWGEEEGGPRSLPPSRCLQWPSPGGKGRETSVERWLSGSGIFIIIFMVQLGTLKLWGGA